MTTNSFRTPFFPDFHKKLFGRRAKRTTSQLAEQRDELGCFALDRLKDNLVRLPFHLLGIRSFFQTAKVA